MNHLDIAWAGLAGLLIAVLVVAFVPRSCILVPVVEEWSCSNGLLKANIRVVYSCQDTEVLEVEVGGTLEANGVVLSCEPVLVNTSPSLLGWPARGAATTQCTARLPACPQSLQVRWARSPATKRVFGGEWLAFAEYSLIFVVLFTLFLAYERSKQNASTTSILTKTERSFTSSQPP